MESLSIQSRTLEAKDLEWIRQLIDAHPGWNRTKLSVHIAQRWQWRNQVGQLKDMACRSMLLKLGGVQGGRVYTKHNSPGRGSRGSRLYKHNSPGKIRYLLAAPVHARALFSSAESAVATLKCLGNCGGGIHHYAVGIAF